MKETNEMAVKPVSPRLAAAIDRVCAKLEAMYLTPKEDDGEHDDAQEVTA